MCYFDSRFRRLVAEAFAHNDWLKYVCWVEDDCVPTDAFTVDVAMRGIDTASPGIAWLAWIPVKGLP
eukprot:1686608-Prorocentrum_lima.AAC.1